MINQTSSLEFSHFPVMLNEVLKISSPSNGGKFVDCTFGGGGYSKAILNFSNTIIQAIDRDKKVLSIAGSKIAQFTPSKLFHKPDWLDARISESFA